MIYNRMNYNASVMVKTALVALTGCMKKSSWDILL